MPQLVRLYIVQCAIGFALAGVMVALLVGLDVGGLGTLIAGSPDRVLAAVMLWVANGLVFAGAQFGISIMNLAEETCGPRRGQPVPIPVRSRDGRRS